MDSPTSSMPPFAKEKNSVKSVSLFSNKDKGLNYYSNLSERQGRGTIDDHILRKKKSERVHHTETRTLSEEKERMGKESKDKKFGDLEESMNAS